MGQPRHITAGQIWDDLKTHGPSSTYQIRSRTGLTHMQFWWGMGFLRDTLQRQKGRPMVYSPRHGVYDITGNPKAAMEWAQTWRLLSLRTQVHRVVETMEVDELYFGPTRERTLLLAGMRGVRATIDALLP